MLPDRAVLCSSYSGNTEETIACYEAAEALGARRIVATTGGQLAESARRDGVPVIGLPAGLQPRAAVGYMFTVAARGRCAGRRGSGHPHRDRQLGGAPARGRRPGSPSSPPSSPSGSRASFPVIYGADLTTPVAVRWKTQINENAKLPAFAVDAAGGRPQRDRRLGRRPRVGRLSAVFLEDRDQHPRVRQRFELTAKLIEPDSTAVARLETEGESRTERLLWAVMLGDLLSLHLAARRGVDPTPIEAIDRLKEELGRPE